MTCALELVFCHYAFSDSTRVAPDAVRNALAVLFASEVRVRVPFCLFWEGVGWGAPCGWCQ